MSNEWQRMRAKHGWTYHFAEWIEDNTAYLSVVFSWDLAAAYQRAVWLKQAGYNVKAGGPAVMLNPDYLSDIAKIGGDVNALPHHNPQATFTSRGCIRQCPFCAVPRIEGELVELDDWEPKPIVCDNNLLACSQRHFDTVIERLKTLHCVVDFNQGLDARLLTKYHAGRLAELDGHIRLAWDWISMENTVMAALQKLAEAGIPRRNIGVYVLIGFQDTPEDALYRLQTLKDLDIYPYPMRYQPLDAIRYNQYVGEHWTHRELSRFHRYWSTLRRFGGIPFAEYGQIPRTISQMQPRLM